MIGRFDKAGLGAVDSFIFFKTLGISPFRGKYDHWNFEVNLRGHEVLYAQTLLNLARVNETETVFEESRGN